MCTQWRGPDSRHLQPGAAQETTRRHKAVVTGTRCPHQTVMSGVIGVWLVSWHTGCQSQLERAVGEVQREKALICNEPWLHRGRDHRFFSFVSKLDSAQSRCRAGNQERQSLENIELCKEKMMVTYHIIAPWIIFPPHRPCSAVCRRAPSSVPHKSSSQDWRGSWKSVQPPSFR